MLEVEPTAGGDHHGFYPEPRPTFDGNANPDIDYVLTTRELAHILRTEKVRLLNSPSAKFAYFSISITRGRVDTYILFLRIKAFLKPGVE